MHSIGFSRNNIFSALPLSRQQLCRDKGTAPGNSDWKQPRLDSLPPDFLVMAFCMFLILKQGYVLMAKFYCLGIFMTFSPFQRVLWTFPQHEPPGSSADHGISKLQPWLWLPPSACTHVRVRSNYTKSLYWKPLLSECEDILTRSV